MAAAKTQGMRGGAAGGLLGGADRARTGGMAAVLGGGTRGRPLSAPRERTGGDKTLAARARVEENRHLKEAQYWGREDQTNPALRAPKRDLPAFWSVSTYGQPFNDERLAAGASNFYKLTQPQGLGGSGADAIGPASAQQAALRRSLETGRRMFTSMAELAPLPPGTYRRVDDLPALSEADREFILTRLTPYQRIHALYHCLDKDPQAEDFYPWPLIVLNREHLADLKAGAPRIRPEKFSKRDWASGQAQRDMLMRMATNEIEFMMRRHLRFMSERECASARAPAALEKDILKRAFWKVDPQRTGCVSVQQFLQVWQNVLCLMEYRDQWVSVASAPRVGAKTSGSPARPSSAGASPAKGGSSGSGGKGKKQQVLEPMRRILLDRNIAAALFVKYGFDKDGLMPYLVFLNALCESPARLLGWEVVIDKHSIGKNGLETDVDIAMCMGNAKIDYRYCKSGVFPPGDFRPEMGLRSFRAPKAHMWLEHVYGYAGMLDYTLASNLYYTYNTGKPLNPGTRKAVEARTLKLSGQGGSLRPEQLKRVELVYYTGSVGVVLDKERFDCGLPCQRFFFGHNNDIQCLAMHPSRRFVATGQQKTTGDKEVPYVCIWDVDHCMQLQRLDHRRDERGVVALGFSGDIMEGKGGDVLVTVTSDDKHTLHVWRWLPHSNKYVNAVYIPGWYLGPEKKVVPMRPTGAMYYSNPDMEGCDERHLACFPFEVDQWRADSMRKAAAAGEKHSEADKVAAILAASRQPLELARPVMEEPDWWTQPLPQPGSERGPNPMWSHLEHPDVRVRAEDADGFYMSMRPVKPEQGPLPPGAPEDKLMLPYLEHELPGCNGTPPMVYGVVWNPLKPSDGRRGSEFATYGVKHLKVWISNESAQYIGTMASFGTGHIENVLSCLYIPAMHAMRSPGDSCLLTGFASGKLGLWVPPYPTRAGALYTLVRHIEDAHAPGPILKLNDGTQVHGGVRALSMRKTDAGGYEVLSGGADGCVKCWALEEVMGARQDGTPIRGAKLGKTDKQFLLQAPSAPFKKEEPPIVVALDCHHDLPREFVAGTNGCDIWEVDADPRILIEGHEADLDEVAAHPTYAHIFATACTSGKCRMWDAKLRDVTMSADLGYALVGIAFSQEQLVFRNENNEPIWKGYHLAVGGDKGQVTIMKSDTMQPLIHRNDVPSKQANHEMKYSPPGGPRMLAVGCSDLTVYVYKADRNYQLVSKCMGHSGTIEHLDWSLPVAVPGSSLDGKFVLQSCDASRDLLYWDPYSGKKLAQNMRDAEWYTWTLSIGFDVMGIWPDGSDGTDINSVDRGRLGAAIFDPYEAIYEDDPTSAIHPPEAADSADGVPGASYVVTADDFSTIKLFNYPVAADDAPYKAFRGHASHVTSVRFLADDRLVVSVGGHDRGIYQWRTCGVAPGLPPIGVMIDKLREATEQAGADFEKGRMLRQAYWDEVTERSRAFRAYERLKLYAMRLAVEDKRVNSMAGAVPQAKLPEQMEWGLIEGTKQYGPVPRRSGGDSLGASGLGPGAAPSAKSGGYSGGYNSGAATPQRAASAYAGSEAGYSSHAATPKPAASPPGGLGASGGGASASGLGASGNLSGSVSGGLGASGGMSGGLGASGSRPPSRPQSAQPANAGRRSGSVTGGVSESFDEVGSYEPSAAASGRPQSRGGPAAPPSRPPTSGAGSVRSAAPPSTAAGGRTPSAVPSTQAGLGGTPRSGGNSKAPSLAGGGGSKRYNEDTEDPGSELFPEEEVEDEF